MLSADVLNAIVAFLAVVLIHVDTHDSDRIVCVRSAPDRTVCGSLRLMSYSLRQTLQVTGHMSTIAQHAITTVSP